MVEIYSEYFHEQLPFTVPKQDPTINDYKWTNSKKDTSN